MTDQIPDGMETVIKQLVKAMNRGSFMVAIFSLNGDQIDWWRMTQDFPVEDFESALELLESNLQEERERIQTEEGDLIPMISPPAPPE